MYLEPQGWDDALQAASLKETAKYIRICAKRLRHLNPTMARDLTTMAKSMKLRAFYLTKRNLPMKEPT